MSSLTRLLSGRLNRPKKPLLPLKLLNRRPLLLLLLKLKRTPLLKMKLMHLLVTWLPQEAGRKRLKQATLPARATSMDSRPMSRPLPAIGGTGPSSSTPPMVYSLTDKSSTSGSHSLTKLMDPPSPLVASLPRALIPSTLTTSPWIAPTPLRSTQSLHLSSTSPGVPRLPNSWKMT